MSRSRSPLLIVGIAGIVGIAMLGLAGCAATDASETTGQPTTIAESTAEPTPTQEPEPAKAVPVELTLGETAAAAGCDGYARASEVAPYVTEWGTCTFAGGNVRAYHFASSDDYASFLDAVSGFGIVEGQLVLHGPFVFAPDDQTQLDALRGALPAN